MAQYIQTTIEVENSIKFIEQRVASGEQFTGNAPALGAVTFVPWSDDYDQVLRYASPTDYAVQEGDEGGLFTFETAGLVSLEYLLTDFGNSVSWTLSIVTRDGQDVPFAIGTGQVILRREYDRFFLVRGDKIKIVTTGGAAFAKWIRLGVTLATGRH